MLKNLDRKSAQERLSEIRRKKTTRKRRLVVCGLVCGLLCLIFFPTQFKIWRLEKQLDLYQQEEQELLAKRQAVLDKIEYYASDGYVEERAREELGLVKPGEIPIRPGVEGRVQPPSDKKQVILD